MKEELTRIFSAPILPAARLLMLYYLEIGLSIDTPLSLQQSVVAATLGLSVNTVRRANSQLTDMGWIRVHDQLTDLAGNFRKGKLILPGEKFTCKP
jgi:hypothetical protein